MTAQEYENERCVKLNYDDPRLGPLRKLYDPKDEHLPPLARRRNLEDIHAELRTVARRFRTVPGIEARLLQPARYGSIVRSGIVERGFPLSDVR